MSFKAYTLGEDNTDFGPADAAALAGKITGPASATDNALVRFDLTTGKLAQNGPATLDDTGKLSGLADPTSAQDAATKAYVDASVQGLDPKSSVRAIATSNITLSGAQTIDGVSIVAGDRVLVAGQTTGSQNGIYVAASGAWTRATDADSSAKVTAGMYVPVVEGTTWADSGWILATNDPITLGSTALVFSQYFGVGVVAAVAANTASIATKASKRLAGNTQTGATYSIVQGDEDTGVVGNRATAQTFTADQLVAGTFVAVFQEGAGQITIAAGAGVTLRAPNGAKTPRQYAGLTLWWRSATEVWVLGEAAS